MPSSPPFPLPEDLPDELRQQLEEDPLHLVKREPPGRKLDGGGRSVDAVFVVDSEGSEPRRLSEEEVRRLNAGQEN